MLTKDIQNNFPFLSVVNYGGKEYIGIVINQDASVTSMYVYTDLNTKKEQEKANQNFQRHCLHKFDPQSTDTTTSLMWSLMWLNSSG